MKGASIKLLFIGLSVLAVSRFTSCRHTPALQASTSKPAETSTRTSIWLHPAPAGCDAGAEYQRYEQLAAVWQRREGLQQWNIDIQLVRAGGLSKPERVGEVRWWTQPGTANILILCPADMKSVFNYTPALVSADNERILVHELMHVALGPLEHEKQHWSEWSKTEKNRIEKVTEAFTQMLLNRRVPGGISVALYINREINSGPWHPAPEVKKQVMLQIIRAMHATSEDDVTTLLARN